MKGFFKDDCYEEFLEVEREGAIFKSEFIKLMKIQEKKKQIEDL